MPGPQEADIYMVKGDLGPQVEITILGADGQPLDLTGISGVVMLAKHQTKSTRFTVPCIIVEPRVDPATGLPVGKALIDWQPGNTDKLGLYDLAWRIVRGGRPQTIPNYTSKQLLIRDI